MLKEKKLLCKREIIRVFAQKTMMYNHFFDIYYVSIKQKIILRTNVSLFLCNRFPSLREIILILFDVSNKSSASMSQPSEAGSTKTAALPLDKYTHRIFTTSFRLFIRKSTRFLTPLIIQPINVSLHKRSYSRSWLIRVDA
jgi:hypothetical protein